MKATWIFSILILFLLSCSNFSNQTEKVVDKQKDEQYYDIVWKDYNRIIGLLSTKYSLLDSVVKSIVLDYLRINKPGKYYSLTLEDKSQDTTVFQYILKPKESIYTTIQRFNEQYGIRKDSISSLLYDLELWLNSNEKK